MSKDNVGGAAFPTYKDSLYLGMSLRDYFAAKAMQGLLHDARSDDGYWHHEARAAYEIADAMLKAREE